MTMSAGALQAQLLGLVPVGTEAEAVATLASAYAVFAAAAQAGAVPITAAGVALGKAAMQSALVGVSASGVGASVLASATHAFWAAAAGGLATSFAGATSIVPPPNAGLQALLEAAFASNTAARATLADAVAVVATDFYNQAVVGGNVTLPGPLVSPIT